MAAVDQQVDRVVWSLRLRNALFVKKAGVLLTQVVRCRYIVLESDWRPLIESHHYWRRMPKRLTEVGLHQRLFERLDRYAGWFRMQVNR